MAKIKEDKDKKEGSLSPEEILAAQLNSNKEDHYNNDEEVPLEKISSGSLLLDMRLGGGFDAGGLLRFVGFTEGGKEQPVSSKVLTPNGWTTIGKLKIGSAIINSSGKTQTILAVYPQGIKDVYEITFDDGSKTRCGIDHLWETSSFVERLKANNLRSVKNTANLIKTVKTSGFGFRKNHSIRLVNPIEFEEKKLPINPYLLGVLIGDGGLTESVSLTSADEFVWSKVKEIVNKDYTSLHFSVRNEITEHIVSKNMKNILMDDLRILGLFGKKSPDKFIPDLYKYSSLSQRTQILHGLIDTDGYINSKKSEILFYSSSKELANDVLDLVRSLGGLARIRSKEGSYKKDGKKIICKTCWMVSFYLPKEILPCSLPRKLKNYSLRQLPLIHFIQSIKLVGKEESVCIKVSSLDSLYVTDDFVLTHNTSESLETAKNFLNTVKKSRALLVKAEGRLSKEMQERSGITFVWDINKWKEGTCFVLETNVYELVVGIMRDLVVNNEDGNRYCFILDSMDGLILKSDMDKGITEASKVAGAPALTKKFLQRLAIAMNKFGHICIMIGQVSAKIEIDPYAPKDNRPISATGGNAALHFSNWILQFEPRNKGDMIVDDPKAPLDPIKNKIHGHWAKVIIKKSPNESSNMTIQYPIKYGRKGGNSIWIEREIVDLLFMWELLEKNKAWIKVTQNLRDEVKDNTKIELPEQIQGIENCYKLLEDNPNITKYLYGKFLQLIKNQ